MPRIAAPIELRLRCLKLSLLLAVIGCATTGKAKREVIAERAAQVTPLPPATPLPLVSSESVGRDAGRPPVPPSDTTVRLASAEQDASATNQSVVQLGDLQPPQPSAPPATISEPLVLEEVYDAQRMHIGQLNLPSAINLAFRIQPRLRVYLASVAQARGTADIAYAPFLPSVSAGASGGGYSLDATGQLGGFSFLPPGGAIPFGLNLNSGFGLEELKM
ncbi:MAG TPA: hypothetical protein VHV77_06825, partial [Pirellulales bacterium]|nr:hypothetical protein [Pirellulales bacterium]